MSKADDFKVFRFFSKKYVDKLGPLIGYGYDVGSKNILAQFYGGVVSSDGEADFYSRLERMSVLVKSYNWILVEYLWVKVRHDFKEQYLIWKDYDVAKAWMENDIKRGEK